LTGRIAFVITPAGHVRKCLTHRRLRLPNDVACATGENTPQFTPKNFPGTALWSVLVTPTGADVTVLTRDADQRR
jgi:hypothetical protein